MKTSRIIKQSIVTKYFGATNFKGSRIKAKCDSKTIYVNWDHDLNCGENHIEAAKELLTKLGWIHSSHQLVTGSHGHLFHHILLDKDYQND